MPQPIYRMHILIALTLHFWRVYLGLRNTCWVHCSLKTKHLKLMKTIIFFSSFEQFKKMLNDFSFIMMIKVYMFFYLWVSKRSDLWSKIKQMYDLIIKNGPGISRPPTRRLLFQKFPKKTLVHTRVYSVVVLNQDCALVVPKSQICETFLDLACSFCKKHPKWKMY